MLRTRSSYVYSKAPGVRPKIAPPEIAAAELCRLGYPVTAQMLRELYKNNSIPAIQVSNRLLIPIDRCARILYDGQWIDPQKAPPTPAMDGDAFKKVEENEPAGWPETLEVVEVTEELPAAGDYSVSEKPGKNSQPAVAPLKVKGKIRPASRW